MKYRELQIQTQREFPSKMRTEGSGWLVRAGYMDRQNGILPLGEQAILRLRTLAWPSAWSAQLTLPVIASPEEVFYAAAAGALEVVHCPSCGYTSRRETARFKKIPLPSEAPLPLEKVQTPDCSTIESLANYLGVPREKTAKALMYTRTADGLFVFVVVRGDMQLSEAKLKSLAGEVRSASPEEIARSGAAAGYASPIRLNGVLVAVDDLIPDSANLVAGANEAGYHLKNTNYGRDYTAGVVGDLALAGPGSLCQTCGAGLAMLRADVLAEGSTYHFETILAALAETHHDEKGLTFPRPAAPFEVYLMHVPGKEVDTRPAAQALHAALEQAGIPVLWDDRDERAGVKFNDADLIGCPFRVTVGERNLKGGMVELKLRKEKDSRLVKINDVVKEIHG